MGELSVYPYGLSHLAAWTGRIRLNPKGLQPPGYVIDRVTETRDIVSMTL